MITKAIPLSDGMPAKKPSRASSPPADAPTPTMGNDWPSSLALGSGTAFFGGAGDLVAGDLILRLNGQPVDRRVFAARDGETIRRGENKKEERGDIKD